MSGDAKRQQQFSFENEGSEEISSLLELPADVQKGRNGVMRSIYRTTNAPRARAEKDPLQRWHHRYFSTNQQRKIRTDYHKLYVLNDVATELEPTEKAEMLNDMLAEIVSGNFASWMNSRELQYVKETSASTYPEVKLKSVTADFLQRSLTLMNTLDASVKEVFEQIAKQEREAIMTIYHGRTDQWLAERGFKLIAEELLKKSK